MTPRLFSRSSVLSGQLPALYGPGQSADAGAAGKYEAPRTWTPAGYLARPPQVVFLSATIPLATVKGDLAYDCLQADPLTYTPGFDIVIGTNEFGYAIRQADELQQFYSGRVIFKRRRYSFDGSLHIYDIDNTVSDTPGRELFRYSGTFHNPFGDEYARLTAEFARAAKIVNDARAGRTFVSTAQPINAFGNLPKRYFTHLLAPDKPDGYYGTDFLHIHVGMPWVVPTTGQRLNFIDLANGYPAVFKPFDDNRDAAFDESIARVKATVGLMHRYGLHLYGLRDTSALGVPEVTTTPVTTYPDPPDFGKFLDDYSTGIGGGDYPYPLPSDPPPTPNAFLGFPGHGASYNGVMNAVNIINGRIVGLSADCEQILQDTKDALDGSGIAVSLMGDTSGVTAESLADEIAAHYGFGL